MTDREYPANRVATWTVLILATAMVFGVAGCDSDSDGEPLVSSDSLAADAWRTYRVELEDNLNRAEVHLDAGRTDSELEVVFPGKLCIRNGNGTLSCDHEDLHGSGYIDITISDDSGNGLSYDLTVKKRPRDAEINDLVVLDEGSGAAPQAPTSADAKNRLLAAQSYAPLIGEVLDIASEARTRQGGYALHRDDDRIGLMSLNIKDKEGWREIRFAARLDGGDRPDVLYTDSKRPIVIAAADGGIHGGLIRVRTDAGSSEVLLGTATGTNADLQFMVAPGPVIREHRLDEIQGTVQAAPLESRYTHRKMGF